METITIVLKGEPMPKQSVRQGKAFGTGKKIFYQPKKFKDRQADYIRQIKSQLPKGFKMFTKIVYIEMLEVMYSPNSSHLKSKKKLDFLMNGGIIEKTTNPDIMDNLNKLPFDCLSGLVFKDDGLICRANNISKVYGHTGQITIIIQGK
jgi:Holliday junction resolvase RusA-like endonuclease